MKNIIFGSAVISALLFSCQSSQNKSPDTVASAALNNSMKDLKQTMSELLPMVADPAAYNDSSNKDVIEAKVHKLAELSKQVQHNPKMSDKDPSLRFISSAFNEDLQRIEESLSLGKRDYARYSLLNVMTYCIECHTRTAAGPSINSSDVEKALPQLNYLERAEFLIAAREFDKALDDLKKFISNNISEKKDVFELDKAVRYALAVTVKYQRDPKKSLSVVSLIEDSKTAPYFLKQNAIGWKRSILEWQKEKYPTKTTLSSRLMKVQSLIKKASENESVMVDRGGDIYYLRALSDLHLILAMPLKAEQLGQSLYLTGVAYEAIKELSLWTLHEDYFESCIRNVPHSKWSQRCYKKLEESIYFGFTGSSGVRVPPEVQARLQELHKLAH